LVVAPLEGFAPGWFGEGRVRFLGGAAAGLAAVVRADRLDGAVRRLALWAAPGAIPAVGDRVRLEAGCDKRLVTCRQKFGNTLNFQAFPHLPGEDWLLLAPRPGAEGGRRGGTL
jgi:uncharacterized phage protein (TIGR02218 family)